MTSTLAIAGIVISGAALGIAAASATFARRQLQLAERLGQRDFEATVVAELVGVEEDRTVRYAILVTNAGPAVARDVDIAIVEWTDSPFGRRLVEADVAPALLRGEQRKVELELPIEGVRFDDRDVSIELHADYYDDNGVRNERLALVYRDDFLPTPPQPPIRRK